VLLSALAVTCAASSCPEEKEDEENVADESPDSCHFGAARTPLTLAACTGGTLVRSSISADDGMNRHRSLVTETIPPDFASNDQCCSCCSPSDIDQSPDVNKILPSRVDRQAYPHPTAATTGPHIPSVAFRCPLEVSCRNELCTRESMWPEFSVQSILEESIDSKMSTPNDTAPRK
jgi:hypothetical protein